MSDKDSLGQGAKRAPGKSSRCPICAAPTEHPFRPFCSRRCQDADLGRWLGGGYRIPTEEAAGDAARGDVSPDDDEPTPGGGH